jgi:hypothetical protein
MSAVMLDWSSAEVRDGKLEVALRGDPPTGWKDGFVRTVALLHGDEWGKVTVKKDRIRVHRVVEGDEDRLRHFLESVVLQANAAVEPPEAEVHERDEAEDDESSDLNTAMTQRFRSFAADTEKQKR